MKDPESFQDHSKTEFISNKKGILHDSLVTQATGRLRVAVTQLKQAVKTDSKRPAEDDCGSLVLQLLLGIAYRANRQVKEAVTLLEQVVKIRSQTLTEDDPDRLASQHEFAGAYKAKEQVREAVGLLERVVKIDLQTLTEDDRSRLVLELALAHSNGKE